jgi:hypothetical protein
MENETNTPVSQPQTPYYQPVQQPIPNAVGVLVLGILSIVFCWCYGIIGIILGIIALVLSSKGGSLYKMNPELYTVGSFNNLKAGKICAIIGLSLSAVYLIIIFFYIVVVGVAATTTPWHMYQ